MKNGKSSLSVAESSKKLKRKKIGRKITTKNKKYDDDWNLKIKPNEN